MELVEFTPGPQNGSGYAVGWYCDRCQAESTSGTLGKLRWHSAATQFDLCMPCAARDVAAAGDHMETGWAASSPGDGLARRAEPADLGVSPAAKRAKLGGTLTSAAQLSKIRVKKPLTPFILYVGGTRVTAAAPPLGNACQVAAHAGLPHAGPTPRRRYTKEMCKSESIDFQGIGKNWQLLSAAGKGRFKALAAIDKQRYHRELADAAAVSGVSGPINKQFAYPQLTKRYPSMVGSFAHTIPQHMVKHARNPQQAVKYASLFSGALDTSGGARLGGAGQPSASALDHVDKRTVTAPVLYRAEMEHLLLRENSNLTPREASKLLNSMWVVVDDETRMKYDALAAQMRSTVAEESQKKQEVARAPAHSAGAGAGAGGYAQPFVPMPTLRGDAAFADPAGMGKRGRGRGNRIWSEDEMATYISGLRRFGKDFIRIMDYLGSGKNENQVKSFWNNYRHKLGLDQYVNEWERTVGAR